jgi:chemotaxis protein histidine kinase CheA
VPAYSEAEVRTGATTPLHALVAAAAARHSLFLMPSSLQQLLLSQCDCTSHRMQAQVRIYEQQQSISTVQQHVQILLQEFGTLESSAHIVESKSTAQQEVIEKQRQTLQKQQLHISTLSMQYSNLEVQRRGPPAAPLATTHDTSAQENGDAPPRGEREVEAAQNPVAQLHEQHQGKQQQQGATWHIGQRVMGWEDALNVIDAPCTIWTE